MFIVQKGKYEGGQVREIMSQDALDQRIQIDIFQNGAAPELL